MKTVGISESGFSYTTKQSRGVLGFTLIEAVIALGVFGFAVAIILGFFLRSTAHLKDVEDRANVISLIPSIQSGLEAMGWSAETRNGQSGILEKTENGGFAMVANSDASVVSLDSETNIISESEQYYHIFVTRSVDPGFRYNTDLKGVLVLKVRVTWPYRTPAGGGYIETPEENRSLFEFVSTVRP